MTYGLIGLLLGVVLGSLGVWRWAMRYATQARVAGAATRDVEIAQLTGEIHALRSNLAAAELARVDLERQQQEVQTRHLALTREHAMLVGQMERLVLLDQELARTRDELRQTRTLAERSEIRAAELAIKLDEQRLALQEKLTLLDMAREQLSANFKALANEILEDKSKRFTEQNSANIGLLLNPLREQLKDFHKTVSEVYDKESRERGLLKHEIESLKNINQRISEDATNLTRALKGDSKTQGAWGELILERLLEACGLQKGREYDAQVGLRHEDGGRPRPDVIVHLPQGRDLVIDAKVSLTAYERYCAAADEAERAGHLAQHLTSIRQHVKDLAGRGYSELLGTNTMDFVLMFIPVEAAYIEAVHHDDTLHQYALGKQVVIVTTSTLLASLRTVASLWRFDDRNRNALEIADRGGKLYEKFLGFVSDLERVKTELDAAQRALEAAFGKLERGSGNLVGQVQKLKELGAKTSKSLDPALLERAQAEELPRLNTPESQAVPD